MVLIDYLKIDIIKIRLFIASLYKCDRVLQAG